MTDLNAESEPLPIRPVKEEWMGHKVSSLLFIDYLFFQTSNQILVLHFIINLNTHVKFSIQGIVEAAAYVHRRLKEEDLLGRAFNLTKVFNSK